MTGPVQPIEPSSVFGRYAKVVAAIVGAVILFASLVITSDSGPITSQEWLAGGIALATAFGVYLTPNKS